MDSEVRGMSIKNTITIIDSTLRDGSHAVRHQISEAMIREYASKAEIASVDTLVVGHGNGLGASSVHLGTSLLSDRQMIETARVCVSKTKLAGFLIPGFGTIRQDIAPAIEAGISELIVACHATEATVTRQHIHYSVNRGLKTYGVLMMSHMSKALDLLEQAKLLESYGASGVILMDSAGAYLPNDVIQKVETLVTHLSVPVGFHAHNNLGLAVSNSLLAVEHGATIIDGTSRGFGAGAGNCQLDAIVALLHATGYETNVNLYGLMDAGDCIATLAERLPSVTSLTIASGLAGVFSGFIPHVLKAAKTYGVDARDILSELGKRKIIAGQEDMIIEVARTLSHRTTQKTSDFQIESLI